MRTAFFRMPHRRLPVRGASATAMSCAPGRLLVAALALSMSCAQAADAPSGSTSGTAAKPRTSVIRPGLYRIDGAGGATLLRADAKNVIVVDANRAGSYAALMEEIRRVEPAADRPVGALVLTAAGPDQAGNIAQFAAAGVPVLVQRRTLGLLKPQAAEAGSRSTIKPFIAYDTDYLLHVGDLEAEVEHVGSGRTGADSVVYFRDLRVVAVGELFTHGAPQPDCASGGSYAGWAAAIAHLMYFDFDVAVPSRGSTVGKPELLALKARLETLAQAASAPASVPAGCRPPR